MRNMGLFLVSLVLLVGCVQNPDFTVLHKTPPAVFPDASPPASTSTEPTVPQADRLVKMGDTVSVDYNLRVENDLVDSSAGRGPFVFQVGSGQVIPGFDSAVIGLSVGQSRSVDILPAQGYGEYDENKIQSLPPSVFADPESLQVGMTIQSSERGWTGVVQSIGRGTDGNISYIEIDFNPRLAGKTLHFEIKILKIE